mmetsp:Transcript_42413/g.92060  ORF Transcript_42413/g.92060 Transcript_42413/m.92060 type:complete len:243 (-) Transcript_42413:302-1030(-)
MPFILLVSFIHSLEDFNLFLGRLLHHIVCAHDFDGDHSTINLILGLADIGEDAFSNEILCDFVSLAHDLADLRLVVPLRVIPVIRRGSRLANGSGIRLPTGSLADGILISGLVEHIVLLRLMLQDEALKVLLQLEFPLIHLFIPRRFRRFLIWALIFGEVFLRLHLCVRVFHPIAFSTVHPLCHESLPPCTTFLNLSVCILVILHRHAIRRFPIALCSRHLFHLLAPRSLCLLGSQVAVLSA